MASFDINEVARRVQSTVGASSRAGPYTFNFQVNATSEIQAYQNDTLLTLSTQYSASLNADGTGSITFIDNSGSGGTDYTPAEDDVITIIGDQPLSRTTTFQVGQVNNPTTLETEFDNLTIRQQQLKEMMDRSIQLKPSTRRTVTGTGTSGPLQFPYDDTASNNANKIVKFDSNGTALELGSTTTNVDAVAAKLTEIGRLGTSDAVADMALLGTTACVADMALLGDADVIADMALLATTDCIADMAILATSDIVSDLNTLATSDIVSDLNTLATSDIVSDINTLATSDIVSDLNTLATSDIVSDLNTLATSDVVTDLNLLATSDFVSDLNTLATSTNVANIATVAANVAGVNSFAERYRVASSDPGSDNDAGDLVYNTTSNTLKYYNGSAFVAVTTDSVSTLTDTNITSAADGAMLLYDTGTSKWIDNAMSGDATMADTGVITIANNAVTTAKINADAVTGAKIADDAIDSEHYADGSIDTAHVADDAITYAKIQDVSATDRILGRDSSGAGVIEEISPSSLRTMINVADGANAYTHPNHTGEVTSTADGATVIADNVVDEANLKVSNAPTNGYFLSAQSGDTGGLTWAEAGGSSAYIGQNVQVFTSSGTYTVPTGVTALKVTVIGGGGAGEKVTAASKKARGGGAGGCAIEWLTSLTPGASIAVTIGAGGTAGGDATAGDGGTSSFASYCSATGGQGGDTNANSPGEGNQEIGHTGGAGSGGTFNLDGGYGGINVRIGSKYYGGNGGYPYPMSHHIDGAVSFISDNDGSSDYVGTYSASDDDKLEAYRQDFAMPQVLGGRAGKGERDGAGGAGAGYGTGGGGAAAESSGTKNGGAGAAGVVIVEW